MTQLVWADPLGEAPRGPESHDEEESGEARDPLHKRQDQREDAQGRLRQGLHHTHTGLVALDGNEQNGRWRLNRQSKLLAIA